MGQHVVSGQAQQGSTRRERGENSDSPCEGEQGQGWSGDGRSTS